LGGRLVRTRVDKVTLAPAGTAGQKARYKIFGEGHNMSQIAVSIKGEWGSKFSLERVRKAESRARILP